jgi:hypothetical protein
MKLGSVVYDISRKDERDSYSNEVVHYLTKEYRVQLIQANTL